MIEQQICKWELCNHRVAKGSDYCRRHQENIRPLLGKAAEPAGSPNAPQQDSHELGFELPKVIRRFKCIEVKDGSPLGTENNLAETLARVKDGSPSPLVIRCSRCHGTLIYKRLQNGEIEVFHGCGMASSE